MVGLGLVRACHLALDVIEIATAFLRRPPVVSAALDGARAVTGGDELPPLPPLSPEVQWGLRLPDGTVVWEDTLYRGHPLCTAEQRATIVEVLRRTAADLNFDEITFLGNYGWARRVGIPAIQWRTIGVYPLMQPEHAINGAGSPESNGSGAPAGEASFSG